MASSGYTAITFIANEQPTTAKWNLIGSNDASFNNGNGFEDNIILTRHILAANVTPAKISDDTWFKAIPGYAWSSVISGTWTPLGTTGTGLIGGMVLGGSNGVQNEEVQFKVMLLAGTYKVYLYADKDINRGIYTISVNGASIGTVDAYSATRVAGEVFTVNASLSVATSQVHTLNVKMATKNGSSSGYYARMYQILFVRTA